MSGLRNAVLAALDNDRVVRVTIEQVDGIVIEFRNTYAISNNDELVDDDSEDSIVPPVNEAPETSERNRKLAVVQDYVRLHGFYYPSSPWFYRQEELSDETLDLSYEIIMNTKAKKKKSQDFLDNALHGDRFGPIDSPIGE